MQAVQLMPDGMELLLSCVMSGFGRATKKLQPRSLKLSAPQHLPPVLLTAPILRGLLTPLMQGLQNLVGLIEESFTESGSLVQIGVDCIWQLLDLQLTPPRVQLCRMLASASLAHNLVRALGSVTREYASLSNHAAVSVHTCGLPERFACQGEDQAQAHGGSNHGAPLRLPNALSSHL